MDGRKREFAKRCTPLFTGPDEEIPRWDDPPRILLVVAGGPAGRFSAVLGPCLGMDAAVVTKEVEWST